VPPREVWLKGHELKYKKLYLNMKVKAFYCAGRKTLGQVAQRGCGSPSLDIFRTHLDSALSNLLRW